MENLIENYINFISENKTERRCAQAAIELAQAKGYRDINTVERICARFCFHL